MLVMGSREETDGVDRGQAEGYHGDVLAVEGFEPDLKSLLRNLRDFVYIVDLEGRMMFMNTNLMHAMGYSVEEARAKFLGRSFLAPLTAESRRVGQAHFVQALRGEASRARACDFPRLSATLKRI